MRSIALASLVLMGCVADATSEVASDVSVPSITGVWVNPSPELYQVSSIEFGAGTFHEKGADLMQDNVVTHETGMDGFTYVVGDGRIRLHCDPADPSTLLYPWEESWVNATHFARLNADGSLSVSPLPGPGGAQRRDDVILQPSQVIGPPCNTCN